MMVMVQVPVALSPSKALRASSGVKEPGTAAEAEPSTPSLPGAAEPSGPPSWWERDRGDEWWKSEEWKDLRGQILDLARDEGTSSHDGRVSLAGSSQRRVLPRGCWLDSKEIKGHGPYLYLRWRVGSRQRSKYLGKGRTSAPGPATGRAAG